MSGSSPSGGKWWRFKYRFGGKEKRLSLGVYPEVSLKDARTRRDGARALLNGGTDPSIYRKMTRATKVAVTVDSFQAVSMEWHKAQLAAKKKNGKPLWTLDHATRLLRHLERNVFPWLGPRPIY
ncbi:MAG: DUF4102 domain-containing protein [Gammaproteobacteria bacterium]|nr:DUF4102 domain-containing protein [Gammaproteobacteria bacterium]